MNGRRRCRPLHAPRDGRVDAILAALGHRPIVLVGMMGAGKTVMGRRLAAHLGLDFVDSDREIEAAAGMTIPEIFARHGEAYFRERRASRRRAADRRRARGWWRPAAAPSSIPTTRAAIKRPAPSRSGSRPISTS